MSHDRHDALASGFASTCAVSRSVQSVEDVSDLTCEIMTISACNRVTIAFKAMPGSCDKGKLA